MDFEEFRNYDCLGGVYHTSGQPTPAQLTALAHQGITTIINLGLHDHPHALEDERKNVAELGMTYIHIPVDFSAPTEADFERFSAQLSPLDPDKVFIHCIMNFRVAAFMYRFLVESKGWPPEHARSPLFDYWEMEEPWLAFLAPVKEAI